MIHQLVPLVPDSCKLDNRWFHLFICFHLFYQLVPHRFVPIAGDCLLQASLPCTYILSTRFLHCVSTSWCKINSREKVRHFTSPGVVVDFIAAVQSMLAQSQWGDILLQKCGGAGAEIWSPTSAGCIVLLHVFL